jgi:hypothetical protein
VYLLLLLLLLLLLPGNGLFTSSSLDKDWQIAHGLLPRSFNQIRIKNYFGVRRLLSTALPRKRCCLNERKHAPDVLLAPVDGYQNAARHLRSTAIPTQCCILLCGSTCLLGCA